MSVWLPGYTVIDLGPSGGSYDRHDNPKLCWHTTEGGSLAGAESAFAPYPPHCAVDPELGQCHQYVPLDRHAYSLKGSDAEDSYVIQVEVVGYAGEAHTWSETTLRWLAENVVDPIAELVGVPPVIAPQGFHGADEGMVLASPSSPIRFTLADWDRFAGHVGHQHAPAPDSHWDPGGLDLVTILSYSGGADMPLNDADKAFIRDTVLDIVRKESISGATDPNASGIDDAVVAALGPKIDAIGGDVRKAGKVAAYALAAAAGVLAGHLSSRR